MAEQCACKTRRHRRRRWPHRRCASIHESWCWHERADLRREQPYRGTIKLHLVAGGRGAPAFEVREQTRKNARCILRVRAHRRVKGRSSALVRTRSKSPTSRPPPARVRLPRCILGGRAQVRSAHDLAHRWSHLNLADVRADSPCLMDGVGR